MIVLHACNTETDTPVASRRAMQMVTTVHVGSDSVFGQVGFEEDKVPYVETSHGQA